MSDRYLQLQNDNDIVKYEFLRPLLFMPTDNLLQLDYGAFHLTPRLCIVEPPRFNRASRNSICIGGTSIAALMKYWSYAVDSAHSSVLFTRSKQKHPIELIQAFVAVNHKIAVFAFCWDCHAEREILDDCDYTLL